MSNPALVSLTFDDGLRCQFEQAVPILDKYGFLATFFLTTNSDPVHEPWLGAKTAGWRKITWSEGDIASLKQLDAVGHEIGSHSISHQWAIMSSQPDRETVESKDFIESNLGIKVCSFCYPYYRSHAFLSNAVKKSGYEQARGGGTPPQYVPRASHYTIPHDAKLDGFNVDCRQILKRENVAEWIRAGCWHVLTFHGIGSERDGWEAIPVPEFARQMEELAKHRDSGAVQVVTFKDGADRVRQPK